MRRTRVPRSTYEAPSAGQRLIVPYRNAERLPTAFSETGRDFCPVWIGTAAAGLNVTAGLDSAYGAQSRYPAARRPVTVNPVPDARMTTRS